MTGEAMTEHMERDDTLERVVHAICEANAEAEWSGCSYPKCKCSSGGYNAATAAIAAMPVDTCKHGESGWCSSCHMDGSYDSFENPSPPKDSET